MRGLSQDEAVKKAIAYSEAGRHCGPSVLQVMLEIYGFEEEPLLWTSYGFAGGIGRCQDVCGALSGGIIALGLDSGKRLPKFEDAWERTSRLSRKLYRGFKTTFGHVDCLSLVGPIMSDKAAFERYDRGGLFLTHCCRYMEWVVRTLVDWYEKDRPR
jgi:C_GCAxxG_C_C family probable redox protein